MRLSDLLRGADFVQGAAKARDARAARNIVPGLPAAPGQSKTGTGKTLTNLFAPLDVAAVSGMSNVQLKRLQGGGIAVEVHRQSKYVEFIEDGDLAGLRKIAARMVEHAQSQSQGTLSSKTLAKRGHPFGHGETGLMRGKVGRSGVPSLHVVNRQSGEFEDSWSSAVLLDRKGVLVRLLNTAPHAAALAMGTVRMQAHGPFTATVAAFQAELNREWQKVIYRAQRRQQMQHAALKDLGVL
jgi:hypothetical protein